MKKAKLEKQRHGVELEERLLLPLIEWVENTHGARTILADKLSKICGKKIHRQEISVWLSPDPTIRRSPAFGMGLLIVKLLRKMAKVKPVILMFAGLLSLSALGQTIETRASWYGRECAGRTMANGRPFDWLALTCASWDYPLGTFVDVRCMDTGKTIRVQVTDRGPAGRLVARGRRLDLSRSAFSRLENPREGVISVQITPVSVHVTPVT